jgi:hypothetical protein
MSQSRTFSHKNPLLHRIRQTGLLLLTGLIPLAAVGLVIIAVILPAPLFVLMAILLLLLMTPALMQLHMTPAVTLDNDGLTITPFIGSEAHIPWHRVAALRVYPLLPSPNQEVIYRLIAGRNNYEEADGLMLVIPGLGWRYRIGGWFAGANTRPVIAVTNRTHADYDALKRRLLHHLRDVAELETPAHKSLERKQKQKR